MGFKLWVASLHLKHSVVFFIINFIASAEAEANQYPPPLSHPPLLRPTPLLTVAV